MFLITSAPCSAFGKYMKSKGTKPKSKAPAKLTHRTDFQVILARKWRIPSSMQYYLHLWHLFYHNIFVYCSALNNHQGACYVVSTLQSTWWAWCVTEQPTKKLLYVLITMRLCINHLFYFFTICQYTFIKHGILQDYKAPLGPISKDSYEMIWEMLCDFIIKDVIPPDSRCYHGPLWNCENLWLWHVEKIWPWCTCVYVYMFIFILCYMLYFCELEMICEVAL
jgi:hypothetical protein